MGLKMLQSDFVLPLPNPLIPLPGPDQSPGTQVLAEAKLQSTEWGLSGFPSAVLSIHLGVSCKHLFSLNVYGIMVGVGAFSC